jgi:hypothetical protein
MGAKLLQCGSCRRRRGASRAVVVFLAGLLIGAAGAGCGQHGHGASTDSEKAADSEALNELLARELTVIGSYGSSLAHAHGRARALSLRLRGQDQAHVDALEKAIRGVGGEADAEPLPLELEGGRPASEAEALTLAYEEENAALDLALGSVPDLRTGAARGLAAALAADHAQHLTVLRQLLGAGLGASVPAPFESGGEPPPERR